MTNNFSKKKLYTRNINNFISDSINIWPLNTRAIYINNKSFFIYNLSKKRNKSIQNKIFYLLLFYFLCNFLSYISNYSDQIFVKNIFYFRFLLFVFSIYYFLNENPKILKLIFYSLFIMFLILIIDGFYHLLMVKI